MPDYPSLLTVAREMLRARVISAFEISLERNSLVYHPRIGVLVRRVTVH